MPKPSHFQSQALRADADVLSDHSHSESLIRSPAHLTLLAPPSLLTHCVHSNEQKGGERVNGSWHANAERQLADGLLHLIPRAPTLTAALSTMEKDVRRQGSKVLAAVLSVSAAAALGLAAVFFKSFAPKKPDAAKPEAVAQPQPEASEVKAQSAPAPAQEVKGPAPSVADKPDSDRAQGRDQGAPTLPSASVQELEAQLKALKEVEDENAK